MPFRVNIKKIRSVKCLHCLSLLNVVLNYLKVPCENYLTSWAFLIIDSLPAYVPMPLTFLIHQKLTLLIHVSEKKCVNLVFKKIIYIGPSLGFIFFILIVLNAQKLQRIYLMLIVYVVSE